MITLKLNRFQSVNGEEEEEVRCGQPLRVWRVLGGNWRWFICIGFIDIILIMKAICFWVMCLWDWCDSRRYYMILPAHSSRNLWSRWKWNEWNPACLKRWGSWRLIDWVFSGSWTSRRFVRERRNRGWGLDVLAFASDGWFESSSIEGWGNGRMGTWGLEGIGVVEALITEVDSIRR